MSVPTTTLDITTDESSTNICGDMSCEISTTVVIIISALIYIAYVVICILGAINAKNTTIKTILIFSAIPVLQFLPVGAFGIIIALGVVFAGWWKTPPN